MKINAVFVFYTLYISLTQRSKKNKYNRNCIKLSEALSKIRAKRRHCNEPNYSKTDHNLNSPHSINTPTNMVSKRILEYQTGG